MKREEAIKGLEKLRTQYATAAEIGPTREYRLLFKEAADVLDAALAALRAPTREQVERMRGYWVEDKYSFSHCSLCGYEQEEPELITPFCANCGSPMTDEAVDIVMERADHG